MTLRPILLHPDPRLRKTCAEVETIDDGVRKLIDDMFETMYAAPGIGLAAPQIGALHRVIVLDCADRAAEEALQAGEIDAEISAADRAPLAMVNPKIVAASAEKRAYSEGCLSIPDHYADVTRPTDVTVMYLDRDGSTQTRAMTGLWATCVQHEIDHLNGKLFIDHLGPVKRQLITQKMKKLKQQRAKERASS